MARPVLLLRTVQRARGAGELLWIPCLHVPYLLPSPPLFISPSQPNPSPSFPPPQPPPPPCSLSPQIPSNSLNFFQFFSCTSRWPEVGGDGAGAVLVEGGRSSREWKLDTTLFNFAEDPEAGGRPHRPPSSSSSAAARTASRSSGSFVVSLRRRPVRRLARDPSVRVLPLLLVSPPFPFPFSPAHAARTRCTLRSSSIARGSRRRVPSVVPVSPVTELLLQVSVYPPGPPQNSKHPRSNHNPHRSPVASTPIRTQPVTGSNPGLDRKSVV